MDFSAILLSVFQDTKEVHDSSSVLDKLIHKNKSEIENYFNTLILHESERITSFVTNIDKSCYIKMRELPKTFNAKDKKVLEPLLKMVSHELIKKCSYITSDLYLNLCEPHNKKFAEMLNLKISDNAAIHSLEIEIKDLNNKLQDYEVIKFERNSLKRQNKELESFKVYNKKLKDEKNLLEKQFQKMHLDLEQKKVHIEEMSSAINLHCEDQKRLRTQILDIKTEKSYLTYEIEKKTSEIDTLKLDLVICHNEKSEFCDKLVIKNSEIENLHNKISNLNRNISKYEVQIKSNVNYQLFNTFFPKELTKLREPEKECAICFEKMEKKVYTKPCGHAAICMKCIPDVNYSCPICETQIQNIELKF